MVLSIPTKPTRDQFEGQGRRLEPLPLIRPAVTALGSSDIRSVDYVDGRLYGFHATNNDDLYVSDDDGATWSLYASSLPGTGFVRRIFATSDGEVVVARAKNILKSANWSSTPTWTVKTTTSDVTGGGDSYSYREWSIDGDGTKFIANEYGNPWDDQADDTYVWISTDSGTTWNVVVTHGSSPFADQATHGHGVCYDRWNDVFYLSPGHGSQNGVWASSDNGANWTSIDVQAHRIARIGNDYSSMTVLVATPRGIVCGTDDVPDGIYYIDTSLAIANQTAERLLVDHSTNASISYFSIAGAYDAERDIVYINHNTQNVTTRPMGIIAIKGRQASRVWSWAEASPVASDQPRSIAINPDTGDLVMNIQLASGTYYRLNAGYAGWGTMPAHLYDTGGVLGGVATDLINGGGVAVGIGSVADEESTAVGASASATGVGSLVLGNSVSDGGFSAVSVAGGGASATANNATVFGYDATAALRGTALGRNADGGQQDATAIGYNADAQGARATVLGSAADAVANATALGYNASAAHDQSAAIGRDSTTTATYQVMVGPRDIEITDDAKGLVLVSPDDTRFRVQVSNAGALTVTSI